MALGVNSLKITDLSVSLMPLFVKHTPTVTIAVRFISSLSSGDVSPKHAAIVHTFRGDVTTGDSH